MMTGQVQKLTFYFYQVYDWVHNLLLMNEFGAFNL